MKIREIMTTNVECVSPDTGVQELANKMKTLDVGFIPVCENDRLVGTVTDRDIVVRGCVDEQEIPLGEPRVVVEDERAVLVELGFLVVADPDVAVVGHDLADRLLQAGVGQVTGDQRFLVGAGGRRFESHRVRELGADDGDEREDQQHGHQGEPALAAHRRGRRPPHCGGAIGNDTVSGGSAATRPLSVVVTVSFTARGVALASAPSQVSFHPLLSSM